MGGCRCSGFRSTGRHGCTRFFPSTVVRPGQHIVGADVLAEAHPVIANPVEPPVGFQVRRHRHLIRPHVVGEHEHDVRLAEPGRRVRPDHRERDARAGQRRPRAGKRRPRRACTGPPAERACANSRAPATKIAIAESTAVRTLLPVRRAGARGAGGHDGGRVSPTEPCRSRGDVAGSRGRTTKPRPDGGAQLRLGPSVHAAPQATNCSTVARRMQKPRSGAVGSMAGGGAVALFEGRELFVQDDAPLRAEIGVDVA